MSIDPPKYTVFKTSEVPWYADTPEPVDDVLVVEKKDVIDATHTPIGQLLNLLDEGIGYSDEQLRRAIRWNEQLSGSCQSILELERRVRAQANTIIDDLEHDLAELRNAVLVVVRNGGGQTIELLRRLVDPAGEEHDCPDCTCWMYKPQEVEE